ncbi:Brix domain-containing protein [Chiua virens]|nr:Brix domain-containing protein [Chiua virens]
MSSMLKVQKANAAKAGARGNLKRKADDMDDDDDIPIQPKKRNKQRVLLLSSRGVTHRMRHLMSDLEALLPHTKKESKLDSKSQLHLLPELADLNNCNNTIYFEARRHEDLYMWAAKTPNGPSIKFHVQNVHTMDELKMTGNCLKGSRGILSFDKAFDESDWGKLTKEILTHIFGVPPSARRAKPFIDHVLTFSMLDDKIWFRNFQALEKDPQQPNGPPSTSLVEIGPRFVLTPIRIFEGAFGGATVYSNPEFITPTAMRMIVKQSKGDRYGKRKDAQQESARRKVLRRPEEDVLAVPKFHTKRDADLYGEQWGTPPERSPALSTSSPLFLTTTTLPVLLCSRKGNPPGYETKEFGAKCLDYLILPQVFSRKLVALSRPMPLALTIQPYSDVLDMYGNADSSSQFSLSGHISVALTSPSLLFVRRRTTTRIVLKSLTITFEGQSETLSPGTGYAAVRLCSITRELLPGAPVDLSNEGHEDSDKSCMWNVVFDIPVPGWLPSTSEYEDASIQAARNSYALYATATFIDINDTHFSFPFANLCGSVLPRTRVIEADRCPVVLRRFIEPELGSSSVFPMSIYFVDTCREPDSKRPSRKYIPPEVLEKIQVVASIPSATAMDETSVPFVLRIRAKDLDDSQRNQLRIAEFSVDVEQVEVYRNSSGIDINQYPIPPYRCQPPRVPLRNSHPIRALYDTGFLGTFKSSVQRSFSILSATESGKYIISGDGRIFTHRNDRSLEASWYILETKIPILTESYVRDWAGTQKRRITESSPLFSVEHHLRVVINCEYGHANRGEPSISERLHFSLPMRHVNVPEVEIDSRHAMEHNHGDVRKNLPYTQTLPAYSQLFNSNGERKVDDSTPLPIYEPPRASPSPESPPLNQQRTL